MRKIESTIYTFDELSNGAKDHARDWMRECIAQDTDWSECVLDDADTIAKILGVEVSTRTVKLYGGGTRQEPVFYWDLDRGAYCVFGGRYTYRKGARKEIEAYAPKDLELARIAKEMQGIQRRYFYRACIDFSVSRGEGMMNFSDCTGDYGDGMKDSDFNALADCVRDFAYWIYTRLRDEWEYQNSEEAIDELIRANEYEFDESGRRA